MEDYYNFTTINPIRVIGSNQSRNKYRTKRTFSMMSGGENQESLKRIKRPSYPTNFPAITYPNSQNSGDISNDIEMANISSTQANNTNNFHLTQNQEALKKVYLEKVKAEMCHYKHDLNRANHRGWFSYEDCCDK